MSQADFLLKIGDLDGESIDDTYKGHIEIQSWSWGVSNSGSMGIGTGGGTGKSHHGDFHFTMWMNKCTPDLVKKCSNGQHYDTATLICRRTGGDAKVEYLKVKFSHVLISSYQTGGSSGIPMDSVSLNFTKIEVEYTPQDEKGKKMGSVKMSHDVKTGVTS